MFSPRFSQANKDYLTFLDGGSKVPYYQDGAKYFPKPYNVIEELELDNKFYTHSRSGYSVGTRMSNFVRSITAQDFRWVKEQLDNKSISKQVINKTQLIMDFC